MVLRALRAGDAGTARALAELPDLVRGRPAAPIGRLDRLPADSAGHANDREGSIAAWWARPVNSRYGRPIRHDPLRQALRLVAGPALGTAEADRRRRTRVLPQVRLRRPQCLGRGPQRCLGLSRRVPAPADGQQPDGPGEELQPAAPGVRHGLRTPLGPAQQPLGRFQ
ncbi:hypothetical protein AB0F52_16835 [Amycolatopsis sp. NPDC024027]|uniref:hypothetical protein n=1 Tax=Amycolatopsis sp. NPDC024027 TaxID=3154327 RepID=UPI0033E8604A